MPEIVIYGSTDELDNPTIQVEVSGGEQSFAFQDDAKILVLGEHGAAVLVTVGRDPDDAIWRAFTTVLYPGPMGDEATHSIIQRPSEFGHASANEAAQVYVPGTWHVFKVVSR